MLLISGSSNIALAENISIYLDIPLVPCILEKFKNGEIRVEISETVRGGDVVIIQTGYSNLPELCVPYCFPFYASETEIIMIKKKLKPYDLECFQWPDLPDRIKDNAPEFYNSIWCIRFLSQIFC